MAPLIIFLAGVFTLLASYSLGLLLLRKLPAPPEIALGIGAAALSLLAFLVLLCGVATATTLSLLGGIPIALVVRAGRTGWEPLKLKLSPVAAVLFAGYGVVYLVNAMAPEILADGMTYHLGLPYEFARTGGFPDRIRFYDMVPLGMEMLYTVAFTFGQHSAAKLVEFGIFLAGIPLIFRIGRRLRLSDTGSLLVALFYFTAPVIAVTGTSSYNDAASVFFALAAFDLVLIWRDTADSRYLLPAGALAGFCYAIKLPGIFVCAAGLLACLALVPGNRLRAASRFTAGAAITAGPWLLRNLILTGNPFAPLMNSLFPNPYFHIATERALSANLRAWGHVPIPRIPWELAFGDGLSGMYGPLLLALPLALLSLRSRAGRLCLAAAAIVSIPWFWNTGARFLMAAVILAAFALALALPRPLLWAGIVVQAIFCWPFLLNLWQPPYTFRLHEFPWRAALRIEPEPDYLRRHTGEFDVAGMVTRATPPDARIFSFTPVANAYLPRDVSVYWQSAEGDRLAEMLETAGRRQSDWFYDWAAAWPAQTLRALRWRAAAPFPHEWDIAEIEIYSEDVRLFNSPQWSLRAWPNVWETPLAFDNRQSTVWSAWQPVRRGMFVELDLDHPQRLTSAVLQSHTPILPAPLEIYGQTVDGNWRLLSKPAAIRRPPEELRREAAAVLRRAGYQYLLVLAGPAGHGPLARQLAAEAQLWGMQIAGEAGAYILLRLQ